MDARKVNQVGVFFNFDVQMFDKNINISTTYKKK